MGSFDDKGEAGPGSDLLDYKIRNSEKDDDDGSRPIRQIMRYPSADKDSLFPSKQDNGNDVVSKLPLLRPEEEDPQRDFQPQSPLRLTKPFKILQIPSVMDSGFENLPWDKIAIGVVLLDDDEAAGNPPESISQPKDPPRHTPPQQDHKAFTQPYQPSKPTIQPNNLPRQPSPQNSPRIPPQENPRPFTTSSRQLSAPVQPSKSVNASNDRTSEIHKPVTMINVGPGVSMPLRGSDETWKAIEDGRVTITSCIFCQIELNCLEDAQLVICPDCTMLSPVDQTEGQENSSFARYGVGVGIKPAEIVEWVKRHM